MAGCMSPSAVPIRWQVRWKENGEVIGVVTERLWFDAREEACQRFGAERGQIELTPLPDDEPVKPFRGDRKLDHPHHESTRRGWPTNEGAKNDDQ